MVVELKIKPPAQRNLNKLFTNFTIPQIVTIHVNDTKFLCSSVILALHSEKLYKMISSGVEDIVLEEFSFEGAEYLVRDCLMFIYGDNITVNIGNILELCKFAIIYGINSLWMECIKYIRSELNQCPENIIHLYRLLGIADSDVKHNQLQIIFDKVLKNRYSFVVNHLYHQITTRKMSIDDIDENLFKSIIILSSEVSHFGSLRELLLLLVSDCNRDNQEKENKHCKIVLSHINNIPFPAVFPVPGKFLEFINNMTKIYY